MIKILFVCHGSICRSPIAGFVMKDLAEKAGLENRFHIEATWREVLAGCQGLLDFLRPGESE